MKKSFRFESKNKFNAAEVIPRISFMVAFIVIAGYALITFKAMAKRQDKLAELYRVGRIYKEQYDELMSENTYLELFIEPQEVMKTLFYKPSE